MSTSPTAAELTARLRDLEGRLWTREYLMKITSFDGATVAPENSAPARGEALGTLSAEHHALLTGTEAVELLDELTAAVATDTITDPQVVAEVRTLARDQREARVIPADEAEAWTRLTCEAEAVWNKAKTTDDWAAFEPYVDRIIETLKRHAGYIDPTRDPYDVWLDQYERGMGTAAYDRFFDQVRETVVPLVHAVGERGEQPDAPWRAAHVPDAVQRELSHDLMSLMGLNAADTTLAYTEHPFSEGFSVGDARVATHIYENDLLSNVYSIIHESGHAAYELGVNPAYARTCLEGGTSMGIHESQSRFFENTIGRSRAFMGPLLAVLRKHVPEVYGNVTEDELYRGANIAVPSLIRTEADELTYPLHIMLRYDIERMLFAGEATAQDIPALWDKLVKQYLGIDVPNNAQGCLQDIHWSSGFGYFPTYALGSAYDAQYVATMTRDGIDLEQACASGELAPVLEWLRTRIWQWGRGKDAAELIRGACGAPFDATFYCEYLATKFGELYKL